MSKSETSAFGYHLQAIAHGEFGEWSKVLEEVAEASDALKQGNKIMFLLELSDMVGAVEGMIARHYPGLSIYDVMVMSDATKRAFNVGQRKPKEESI